MNFQSLFVVLAASLAVSAVPVIVNKPQCGGIGWTGSTVCTKPDYVCHRFNDYYYECLHKSRVVEWTPPN